MKLAELRVRTVVPGSVRVMDEPKPRVSRKPGGNLTFIKHQIPVDWAGVEQDRIRAHKLGGEYLAAFERWWVEQVKRGRVRAAA